MDARTFVDKVIGYEQLEPDVQSGAYLEQICFIADRWQHKESSTGRRAAALPAILLMLQTTLGRAQ